MSVVIPSLRAAIAVPSWAKNELWRRARAVPSLDLRFADNKSLVDAVTGASLVTFTRASSGTFVDSAGVIQTAATDVPRFDHNPTTLESLGLLVEEQRTNLLLRSEGFDTTWPTGAGSGNFVVTANDAIAPNGSLTADRGTDTVDGSNQAHQTSQGVELVSGLAYTASVYAKLDTAGGLALGFAGSGAFSAEQRVSFNLVNQTSAIQLGTPTNLSIVAVGDGWYRVSVSFTATASGTGLLFIRILDSSQSGFYQGTGSQSLFLWGAQLEAGAFPTSYIPTTTAAVTRSADVASITGSNFSSWYNQGAGTLFANGVTTVPSGTLSASIQPSLAFISDDTANNRIGFFYNTANTFVTRVVVSGTQTNPFDSTPGTLPAATRIALAATTGANGAGASVNGNTPGSSSPAAMPVVDRLFLGTNHVGAAHLNGTIRRLAFWGQRLPNNILQSITQ
jgi:hypothetical protein